MNKILKYGLLGVGIPIGIAVSIVAYVALTFDPNDYKAQIIKTVKDKQQRDLHLDGDIKLSFYPNIGVSLSKVSLSEFQNKKEFAAIESARVALALIPLLSKQVVVDDVALSGLKANLVKHKDGSSNIDDLLNQAESKHQPQNAAASSPVKFDIASVSITNTNLSYHDEGSGAQYTIKNLTLKTGRIAVGVPSKIDLAVGVQANQPKLDINAQLKTTLSFNLEKQKYQLQGLEFEASGIALDMSNLKIKAGGDASAELSAQEFAASKFSLSASGVKGKDKFDVALNAPSLNLAKNSYVGEKLTLIANLQGGFGDVVASLLLPAVEGNAQAFKVSALSLEVDVKQPEQAFKIKLSSPLSGNIKTQQFNLSNLAVAVHATGDKLPNKSVSSEMKGSVQVDVAKQGVQVKLAGGLLQSQIKASVGVNNFSKPAIKFDVELDQLDADLYLPKTEKTAASAQQQPEQPLDLSALRELNLDGSLRIGALKIMNVKSTQLRVDVKALNGLVNISPLSAKLYQGSLSGSLNVNAQATPSITIVQNLNGINVAALTKDAANFDTLEGRGNVGVNLTAKGNTVGAMKRSLNGNLSLNLTDGAIKGINVAKKLRDAKAMFSAGKATAQTQAANQEEKTDFSELKATFKVTNGIARNDDLSLKSPLIRLTGAGDINIGDDSINYLAKATLAKSLEGQGGKDDVGGVTVPVRLSGPYTSLKYSIDYGAMVKEETKQKVKEKVEAKKEEIKSKVQEQLKDKLKGLFR